MRQKLSQLLRSHHDLATVCCGVVIAALIPARKKRQRTGIVLLASQPHIHCHNCVWDFPVKTPLGTLLRFWWPCELQPVNIVLALLRRPFVGPLAVFSALYWTESRSARGTIYVFREAYLDQVRDQPKICRAMVPGTPHTFGMRLAKLCLLVVGE